MVTRGHERSAPLGHKSSRLDGISWSPLHDLNDIALYWSTLIVTFRLPLPYWTDSMVTLVYRCCCIGISSDSNNFWLNSRTPAMYDICALSKSTKTVTDGVLIRTWNTSLFVFSNFAFQALQWPLKRGLQCGKIQNNAQQLTKMLHYGIIIWSRDK